jgi:NitT/TauT family transport system permease protein
MSDVLVRIRRGSLELISPIVVLVVWQILAKTHTIDSRFWPAPTDVASQLWTALLHGDLAHDTLLTTQRLAIGLLIGGSLGLIAGVGMGLWRPVRIALRPLIAMTYPIPKIAILPLFLVIFGIGETSKWALVAVGVFYMVAINTFAGIQTIDPVFEETATVYRVSWWRRIRTVTLPGALPLIITGLELGIGVGFLLVVAAEFVSAQSGLGYSIWQAWQTFNVPLMYAALAVVAVYGIAIQLVSRWLNHRLAAWRGRPD